MLNIMTDKIYKSLYLLYINDYKYYVNNYNYKNQQMLQLF